MAVQGLVYAEYMHYNTTLHGHIIASYCFQSSVGLANLLSAISYYKFHILKD